jgi:ERCC4-type nuclease
MTGAEVTACLESMSVLVDTREQPSGRALRRYKRFGAPYRRQKLEFGDYTYNFVLPDGRELYTETDSVLPPVVVERKANLEELSGNLTEKQLPKHKAQGVRNRFEAELLHARQNGTSVYLLVEDASISNVLNHQYDTRLNETAFFHTLTAYMARYDLKLIFCQHDETGSIIKEILFRELKERLTRGDYG